MKNTTRRLIFIFLAIAVLVIALPIGGLATLVWYRSWGPFLDDGPFHGRQRENVPDQQPDQVFSIYGGMKLLVYDPEPNEPAPTVLLRSRENKVLWCIYAEADDMPDTTISNLRFRDYRRFPFKRPRIVGDVDWTYGLESTWWFISENGKLQEYWFSW